VTFLPNDSADSDSASDDGAGAAFASTMARDGALQSWQQVREVGNRSMRKIALMRVASAVFVVVAIILIALGASGRLG
jgi:hypothetical protein